MPILYQAELARQNLLCSIPFEFVRGEIVAQVRIGEQESCTVLLDTGTAPSVIDLELTKKLRIKFASEAGTGSGGGTGKTEFHNSSIPLLNLHGLTIKNVKALVTDLSGLSKTFGRHIDAVLGDSVFDGRVVQFDYPAKVARFFRSDPGSSGVKLRFVHEGSEVHLSGVRVNGRPIIANLDTGANTAFQVTPRGLRKLRLEAVAAGAKQTNSAGFNGSYVSRTGKLARVRFGLIEERNQEATFWLPGTGHDDRAFDLNVGNAFLKGYVVTIDYRHNLVRLAKNSGVSEYQESVYLRKASVAPQPCGVPLRNARIE